MLCYVIQRHYGLERKSMLFKMQILLTKLPDKLPKMLLKIWHRLNAKMILSKLV